MSSILKASRRVSKPGDSVHAQPGRAGGRQRAALAAQPRGTLPTLLPMYLFPWQECTQGRVTSRNWAGKGAAAGGEWMVAQAGGRHVGRARRALLSFAALRHLPEAMRKVWEGAEVAGRAAQPMRMEWAHPSPTQPTRPEVPGRWMQCSYNGPQESGRKVWRKVRPQHARQASATGAARRRCCFESHSFR